MLRAFGAHEIDLCLSVFIRGSNLVTAILKPTTRQQVVDAVSQADADVMPVETVGQGRKRGLGRPVQAARQLDLSGLSGITDYEPSELVLTCLAGTPLAEIERALAAKNQQLAFEPPGLGPLY